MPPGGARKARGMGAVRRGCQEYRRCRVDFSAELCLQSAVVGHYCLGRVSPVESSQPALFVLQITGLKSRYRALCSDVGIDGRCEI